MKNGNETASRLCRFLREDVFDQLFATFSEAFSDYVFPFALTETQFRNHLRLNAVDLSRTVGCFDGDRMIGFSLNGFGEWRGRPTVYDAGTGVIPSERRRGVSRAMFAVMLPAFEQMGLEQFLLEVITTNAGAIRLYETLDFEPTRELALLQCDGSVKPAISSPAVDFREIEHPDWAHLQTFWDGSPSWQNSPEAVDRSRPLKRIVGAFDGDKCVGYVVFSANFGRLAQLAVTPKYRNRGIGSALVQRTQSEAASGFSIQVINVDKSLPDAINFFRNRGFYERLSQYEMIRHI